MLKVKEFEEYDNEIQEDLLTIWWDQYGIEPPTEATIYFMELLEADPLLMFELAVFSNLVGSDNQLLIQAIEQDSVKELLEALPVIEEQEEEAKQEYHVEARRFTKELVTIYNALESMQRLGITDIEALFLEGERNRSHTLETILEKGNPLFHMFGYSLKLEQDRLNLYDDQENLIHWINPEIDEDISFEIDTVKGHFSCTMDLAEDVMTLQYRAPYPKNNIREEVEITIQEENKGIELRYTNACEPEIHTQLKIEPNSFSCILDNDMDIVKNDVKRGYRSIYFQEQRDNPLFVFYEYLGIETGKRVQLSQNERDEVCLNFHPLKDIPVDTMIAMLWKTPKVLNTIHYTLDKLNRRLPGITEYLQKNSPFFQKIEEYFSRNVTPTSEVLNCFTENSIFHLEFEEEKEKTKKIK